MEATTTAPVLSDLAADWATNRMTEEEGTQWLRQFSGNDTFKTLAHAKIDEYSFRTTPFTGDDLYYLPPVLMRHCSFPLLFAAIRDFEEDGEAIENFFLCHAAYIWRILNSSGTPPQRRAFATLGQMIEKAYGLADGDDDAESFRKAIQAELN